MAAASIAAPTLPTTTRPIRLPLLAAR